MKNFDELFAEAAQVSDRRKQVFNALIEKTKSSILPKFCEACEAYDIERVYFKFWNKSIIVDHHMSFTDEIGDKCYGVSIDVINKTIEDCVVKQFGGACGDSIEFCPNDSYHVKISEVKLTKTGIVGLVTALNNRLLKYNEKYTKEIEKAKTL